MENKDVATLAIRIDPKLHQRVRVRVAQLGRPWTLSRYVVEALREKLGRKDDSSPSVG